MKNLEKKIFQDQGDGSLKEFLFSIKECRSSMYLSHFLSHILNEDSQLIQTQLDDPTFAKLLDLALRQVTSPDGKRLSLQKFKGLDEKHSIIAKSIYASLIGFILEAAKTDSSESALSAQLQEAGLGEARIKLVAKKYDSNVENIQKILGSIGFKLPKIVGIDWRLDYTLRSSTVGKLNDTRIS